MPFCPVKRKMHHISLTPFGRQPVTAGLIAGQALARARAALPSVDKWTVFDNLRGARAAYGLKDRDLAVLHALLSFLPGRDLIDGAQLVVFPSNGALAERAHGMSESTLRRHLANLVAAGIIARRDSPNGKRYAARDRAGQVNHAYGFDLRPLLVRAPQIAAEAEEAETAAQALHQTRAALVLMLRDAAKLLAWARQTQAERCEALEERLTPFRKALRRRLAGGELAAMREELAEILEDIQRLTVPETAELGGCDSQNDRHHTKPKKDSEDLEPGKEAGKTPPAIPLGLVTKACPEIGSYGEIRSWRDLWGVAGKVAPMMGITASAWAEAQRIMGPEVAAVAVAGILQRFGIVRNPGGYLRSLSQRAAEGRFSAGSMVMALLNGEEQRRVC